MGVCLEGPETNGTSRVRIKTSNFMKLETLTSRRRNKETLHACGPCGMQEPELGSFSLDSSEPLEASAAPITEPPDLQMHPILEHWECNSDGSITGRVYGKLGWEEGIQMTTSIVPAETHYATYVITVSGSIYRLGEKLPGVGQTNTRNADAQLWNSRPFAAEVGSDRVIRQVKASQDLEWDL